MKYAQFSSYVFSRDVTHCLFKELNWDYEYILHSGKDSVTYQNSKTKSTIWTLQLDMYNILLCFCLRPMEVNNSIHTLHIKGCSWKELFLIWSLGCCHWRLSLSEKVDRNIKRGGSVFPIFLWHQNSFITRACHSSWVRAGLLFIWVYIQQVLPCLSCGFMETSKCPGLMYYYYLQFGSHSTSEADEGAEI